MHKQVQEWLVWCKKRWPEVFTNRRVLEVGSRDINGSNRKHFVGCTYTGLDCQAGPNVDLVGFAHEVVLELADYDTVISTELLEHDPHWQATVAAMVSWLRPGGALLITCATPDRAPHGLGAQGYGPDPTYYRNIGKGELLEVLKQIEPVDVSIHAGHHDLRFFGMKRQ